MNPIVAIPGIEKTNMPDKTSIRIEDVDLKLLRLLDALHATKSVTRAAERLSLSQPTVSIGLARLREMLKDPLFVRTTEGMQPTPRVEDLMASVRQVLSGVAQFVASTSNSMRRPAKELFASS